MLPGPAIRVTARPDGSVLLAVKVVPGASRQRIVGPHGDALKVAVSAPPEGGRANRAACELLAEALTLPARSVTIHSGAGSPFKTLRIAGVTAEQVRARLRLA